MKSRFYIPNNKRSTYSIALRFSHNGQHKVYTGVQVPSTLWLTQGVSMNQDQLRKAGWSVADANNANERLLSLQGKLHELYAEELQEEAFDIQRMLQRWTDFRDGKKIHKARKKRLQDNMSLAEMILKCAEYKRTHAQGTTANNKPISKATLSNYFQAHNAVLSFDEFHKTTTRLDEVDLDFYSSFVNFLWTDLQLTGSTPSKIVRNLKTALKWADLQGMKVCTDYRKDEFCQPQADEDSEPLDAVLTWDEIALLRGLELTGTAEVVRDLFAISCYTGMRASDLEKLHKVKIQNTKKGAILQWKPTKAKSKVVTLAMRSEIKEIRDRWKGWPPEVSSQTINNYIKGICKAAGLTNKMEGPCEVQTEILGKVRRRKVIKKQPRHDLVTCHSGRRSFCTNWYDDIGKPGKEGLSVEQIMRWSGHKKRDTFFIYINREPISDGEAMFAFLD
jgi:integrase